MVAFALAEVGLYVVYNNIITDPEMGIAYGKQYVNDLYAEIFSPSTLGLLVLLFAAIFGCGEFRYNTVRNKIVAGYSRTNLFFSTLTVNYFVAIVYALIGSAAVSAVGIPVLGWSYNVDTLISAALSLFVQLPLVAFVTMIGFACRSRGGTIAINLAVLYGVTALSSIITLFVTYSPIYEWIVRIIFISLYTYLSSLYGLGICITLSYWEINVILNYLGSTIIFVLLGWVCIQRAELK
jgi:hypothetical protein